MRSEFVYKGGGDVRWDLVAAMFPTTMRPGWRRSVNVFARELIPLASQDPSFRDGQDGRDNLLLVIDAGFVDRLHRLDHSTFNAVVRERNPFPALQPLAGKFAPWWDTVMGRSHMAEAFDAYPQGQGLHDHILASHGEIWEDPERDAHRLYVSMLTQMITAAMDELDLTLHGADIIQAARNAGVYNPTIDKEYGDDR